MQTTLSINQVSVLILAGGRGQRMQGTDKGLMLWKNRPMIEHIIQHIHFPASKIIISANRNLDTYKNYAHTVIADDTLNNQQNNFQGPLAGIYAAMSISTTPFLLCVPCDSPAPPDNLFNHLSQCLLQQQKTSALCHDGSRQQPLFSLLSCKHKQLLFEYLQQGHRKVHDFFTLIDPAICDFSQQHDRFNNFNFPDDMKHE